MFEIYFSGLYSSYAFANLFVPFINGALRDKFGDRLMAIILTLFCTIGQFIFYLGITNYSFFIMYIGRIVFGIGCEALLPLMISYV